MNLRITASIAMVLLLAALLTTVSSVRAQAPETPTGLRISETGSEIEWDEVSGTTYYLIKWVSVIDDGKPGIAQARDGSGVTTSLIEENVTPGAMIQSISTAGTSIEMPEDLADGWWFLFVAAATSGGVSDYSEPVYFEVSSYETPDVPMAMRWWNVLNGEQMVAALFGDDATEEQMTAARNMYADLDSETKGLVNAAAAEIYG
ncbi:MAG: hypothetical protein OXC95_10915, partial [Dehalococcoidia bacterium]|nr:hypothetical protein [Dehalococcoidia bacterium]